MTSGNDYQPESMEELLDAIGLQPEIRRGRTVQGIIMHKDSTEGLLVNIGGKSEGLVPLREMRSISNEQFDALEIGKEIYTYVIRQETEEGVALLSIDRALHEKGWTTLEKALTSEEILEGELIGNNRGGLLINIDGVQAFIPLSHVSSNTKNAIGDPSNGENIPNLSNKKAWIKAIKKYLVIIFIGAIIFEILPKSEWNLNEYWFDFYKDQSKLILEK